MQKGLILMPHISLLFFKPKSLTQPTHKLKGENLPFIFLKKSHQRDTNKNFVFGQVHVWEKGRSWKPKHERVEDLTQRWHFWDINQREREISKGIIGLWACCKRYLDYAPAQPCLCTLVMTPCLLLFLALHYKCQFLIYPCQYTLHPQGAKLRFYRSAVARLPPLQITIGGETTAWAIAGLQPRSVHKTVICSPMQPSCQLQSIE